MTELADPPKSTMVESGEVFVAFDKYIVSSKSIILYSGRLFRSVHVEGLYALSV